MRTIVTILLAALPAAADEPRQEPSNVDVAIQRGLGFLQKDALAWKEEHDCVSCHHAALVIWSMHEARQRGHAVDDSFLSEFTKWVAESGNGKTGVPRPEGRPKALNVKAVLFALALEADPEPDEETRTGLELMLQTVREDQIENGSWVAWPETRPPIFGGSDDSMTALAALALVPAAASGDEPAKGALDRAVQWLAETPTDDDPQSVAMRLVIWSRLNRPSAEREPLMQRIRERQNADGGWSQASDMASDAWATGQALYALAHAGMTSEDEAVKRAQSFLVSTQRDDGSWPMTSRPMKPGGEGAGSLIPITGGGSAWAVLGLVRSR
jgi:squalene-hopene/tetraprenyl-beta-curcumene cyclase